LVGTGAPGTLPAAERSACCGARQTTPL
jgi:hypothetical protein